MARQQAAACATPQRKTPPGAGLPAGPTARGGQKDPGSAPRERLPDVSVPGSRGRRRRPCTRSAAGALWFCAAVDGGKEEEDGGGKVHSGNAPCQESRSGPLEGTHRRAVLWRGFGILGASSATGTRAGQDPGRIGCKQRACSACAVGGATQSLRRAAQGTLSTSERYGVPLSIEQPLARRAICAGAPFGPLRPPPVPPRVRVRGRGASWRQLRGAVGSSAHCGGSAVGVLATQRCAEPQGPLAARTFHALWRAPGGSLQRASVPALARDPAP